MNRLKIIPMIALLFWSSSVASGQDGCPGYSTGERRFAEGIVSTLPSITGAELRQGRFVVKEKMVSFGGSMIGKSEFTVSFVSRGRVVFQKYIGKPAFISDDRSCTQDISIVTEKGASALYFSFDCGQGQISTGCFILVYPVLNAGGTVSWQYKIEGEEGASKRFRQQRRKPRRH